MNARELTGHARSHVVEVDGPGCVLHRNAVPAFRAMRTAAARAGIVLVAVSGFRDFARQREIWNAKFRGERPLLDAAGRRLNAAALDEARRVDAILLWTALPGASRHHWGTDLDVIDRRALPAGQQVRLVPEEYGPGGVFEALTRWLDRNMRRYGFYRPYDGTTRGTAPEPWHLSFAPVAQPAGRQLDVATLAAAVRGHGVLGEARILRRLPEIHRLFVRGAAAPPRMRSRWAVAPRRAAAGAVRKPARG